MQPQRSQLEDRDRSSFELLSSKLPFPFRSAIFHLLSPISQLLRRLPSGALPLIISPLEPRRQKRLQQLVRGSKIPVDDRRRNADDLLRTAKGRFRLPDPGPPSRLVHKASRKADGLAAVLAWRRSTLSRAASSTFRSASAAWNGISPKRASSTSRMSSRALCKRPCCRPCAN